MSPPLPGHFVIVPRKPRTRALVALLLLLWLASLWAVAALTQRWVAPALAETRRALDALRIEHQDTAARLERSRDRATVLNRSDQVSRAANQELQSLLAERDEEIAQLRADLAFYERLVGNSSQRQGLTVHSLALDPGPGGAWNYTLTLTQNLKKAKVSKGEVTLRIDGVRAGKLASLRWDDLLQDAKAEPLDFAFKYFQQLEGSVMVPPDFIPHRVWVLVKSDSGAVEQSFPWQAAQTQGA